MATMETLEPQALRFWEEGVNARNFCAIRRKEGSERLGNAFAGVKHSCARSKVNSENFGASTVMLLSKLEYYNCSTLSNTVVKLLSRCFFYLLKYFARNRVHDIRIMSTMQGFQHILIAS